MRSLLVSTSRERLPLVRTKLWQFLRTLIDSTPTQFLFFLGDCNKNCEVRFFRESTTMTRTMIHSTRSFDSIVICQSRTILKRERPQNQNWEKTTVERERIYSSYFSRNLTSPKRRRVLSWVYSKHTTNDDNTSRFEDKQSYAQSGAFAAVMLDTFDG